MFTKYKEAEPLLQQKASSLGYSVLVEPITTLDLYYSDGAAASSHGKIFLKKDKVEYLIFFPDMYCFHSIPPPLKETIQTWLQEIK